MCTIHQMTPRGSNASTLSAAPTKGNLGLPAELLSDADGRVAAAKYRSDAYDQWSVDELLSTARNLTERKERG